MSNNNVVPMDQFERETNALANKPRFRFDSFFDATLAAPSYNWLIDSIIPERSTVLLYSPPKYAKTFLALDWSLSIAGGLDWFGREARPGGVVYLSGEGKEGFNKRLAAWKQENRQDVDLPFLSIVGQKVSLMDADGDVKALIGDCKREEDRRQVKLSMMTVDTVARHMRGADENSGKDMGRFIDNLDTIRDSLGVTLLALHHTGKDKSKGMRGHTNLHGALDVSIELMRDESRLLTAVVQDQKDGVAGERFPFRLKRVVVGTDARERDVSSCVVVRSDEEARSVRAAPSVKGPAKIAYQILWQSLLDFGKRPDTTSVPQCVKLAVDWKIWREACLRGGIILTDDESKLLKAFENAGKTLRERGMIGVSKPWVWDARAT